jgi:NADH-quinone oxidoreductase subunit N
MLVPFAVAGDAAETAQQAVVVYLIIYAFMNLGAFAIILAVSRKTRSGEVDSFNGLFHYAPGLTALMTLFLASLAGIPPAGGWLAKFTVFRALLDAGTASAALLAVVVAINTVIAFAYYARLLMAMWFNPVAEGDDRPIEITGSIKAALGITALATLAFGVLGNFAGHFGEVIVLTQSSLP